MQTLTRTSDVRVSERGALTSLRLKPSPPVYNELTGEVSIMSLGAFPDSCDNIVKIAGAVHDPGIGPEFK